MPNTPQKNFNGGKPYHGSNEVSGGKLKGQTDTDDHFYFLCPKCADNTVLQILDFDVVADGPRVYCKGESGDVRRKAKRDFTLAFQLYCLTCKLKDFVKISNTDFQGGRLSADGLGTAKQVIYSK